MEKFFGFFHVNPRKEKQSHECVYCMVNKFCSSPSLFILLCIVKLFLTWEIDVKKIGNPVGIASYIIARVDKMGIHY